MRVIVAKTEKFTNTTSAHMRHFEACLFYNLFVGYFGITLLKNCRRDSMSRLALFILTLHLPLYIHAADPEKSGSTDAGADSTSSSESRGDLSDLLSMDSALRSSLYADHVDISGMKSYAEILGISADPSNRSTIAAILRWGVKQSGSLQSDIAGVGSLDERRRTERTFRKFVTMLETEQDELDPETLKQVLDRQAAAMAIGASLLKALQSSNSGKPVPDILMKIQAAQQLLTVNEHTTLPPAITTALKAALAIARDKTTHQMHPQEPEE